MLETSKAEEITKLTSELLEKDKKFETDLQSYREQIKQHSVTICAMEDRVTKVMKKNKECQEEMENYRKRNQGKVMGCLCTRFIFPKLLTLYQTTKFYTGPNRKQLQTTT